jgi:hypothetical protein
MSNSTPKQVATNKILITGCKRGYMSINHLLSKMDTGRRKERAFFEKMMKLNFGITKKQARKIMQERAN